MWPPVSKGWREVLCLLPEYHGISTKQEHVIQWSGGATQHDNEQRDRDLWNSGHQQAV